MADDINSDDYKTVRVRIMKWIGFRSKLKEPSRYLQLKDDLWVARNPKHKNSKGRINKIPADLIDERDYINASVEHYFICRAWVGNGVYPLSQVELMTRTYNLGKTLGLTPAANPDQPVTPPSEMQRYFQQQGMYDGSNDADTYGTGASPFSWSLPPLYY